MLDRGVDKRLVFMDEEDHYRFIHDLYVFNDTSPMYANGYFFQQESFDIGCQKIAKDRACLVDIHAFALMPNHYHLLLSPLVEDGIPKFMKKLNMGYSKYFNEKNKRTGALWQGKYKSISVVNDGHFLYIPFYIHFNPLDMFAPEWRKGNIRNRPEAKEFLKNYRWSSHLDYLGIKNFPSVTNREMLLDFFEGTAGYAKTFKEELKNFSMDHVGEAALEWD